MKAQVLDSPGIRSYRVNTETEYGEEIELPNSKRL